MIERTTLAEDFGFDLMCHLTSIPPETHSACDQRLFDILCFTCIFCLQIDHATMSGKIFGNLLGPVNWPQRALHITHNT